MDNNLASIENIALGAYDKYYSHMDYNQGDYLLKIITESEKTLADGTVEKYKVGNKQLIDDFLATVSSKVDYAMNVTLHSFLNLLLVPTNEFLVKYYEWLEKLAKLNAKAFELEDIIEHGKQMRLHKGMVIHSALADTENKMKEQFGGYKWKRIMNFPLLVKDSDVDKVGTRGGESFVSLIIDHLPNHRHGLTKAIDSEEDKWKRNFTGRHPFLAGTAPGLTWTEKKVYPEISSLNWNQDIPKESNGDLDPAKMEGGARYVKPHFNIPPYKDVYIWECEEPFEVETRDGRRRFPRRSKKVKEANGMKERAGSTFVPSKGETTFAKFPEIPAEIVGKINDDSLAAFDALDGWATFISDDLAGENLTRYESKDAPMPDLAQLMSWDIWCNVMHIERTYLFKDVYKYLIEDIQDRIYLLMGRIIQAMKNIGQVKHKVVKGEYVFLYGDLPENKTEAQVLEEYYKLPEGCTFVKVTNVFLRGTSMFTEETKELFNEYVLLEASDDTKKDMERKLTTSGGLSTVNLYAENFPKHLHWSTLLTGMDSASVSDPVGSKTGGTGSAMMMNDMRSGGFKYGTSAGTGPYKVTVNEHGTTDAVSHNNIPKYITMSVYVVS